MSALLRRLSLSLSLASLLSVPLSAQSLSTTGSTTGSTSDPARFAMSARGVALRHRAVSPQPLASSTAASEATLNASRGTSLNESLPAPLPAPEGFASSNFAQFMSSPAGRVLRVVAGVGMIAGGIAADSDLGTGIAIAGAVPLLAGAFDFCVLSPLFGGPLSGKEIRAAKP